jgi:hypothetical protein
MCSVFFIHPILPYRYGCPKQAVRRSDLMAHTETGLSPDGGVYIQTLGQLWRLAG